jgi:hypothetical protein
MQASSDTAVGPSCGFDGITVMIFLIVATS